jgi:hypothetical protein
VTELERFEASEFEFPPISVSDLSAIAKDGCIPKKLQDYFWHCGFAGWRAAIAAEREACARIADEKANRINSRWIAMGIAHDIRMRSNVGGEAHANEQT